MSESASSGWLKPTWYQTLVGISGVLLLILAQKELWSATVLVGGFLLVGIGEWINHPWRLETPPGLRVIKTMTKSRKPHWLGWVFDAIGAINVLSGLAALLLGLSKG